MIAKFYNEMIALLAAIVVLGAGCGLWLMVKAVADTARAVWRWACWIVRGTCRG